MEFRWRKSEERNERDIERALSSRGTFLSRTGVEPHTSLLRFAGFFLLLVLFLKRKTNANCKQRYVD
jgi:hypothetical protein